MPSDARCNRREMTSRHGEYRVVAMFTSVCLNSAQTSFADTCCFDTNGRRHDVRCSHVQHTQPLKKTLAEEHPAVLIVTRRSSWVEFPCEPHLRDRPITFDRRR